MDSMPPIGPQMHARPLPDRGCIAVARVGHVMQQVELQLAVQLRDHPVRPPLPPQIVKLPSAEPRMKRAATRIAIVVAEFGSKPFRSEQGERTFDGLTIHGQRQHRDVVIPRRAFSSSPLTSEGSEPQPVAANAGKEDFQARCQTDLLNDMDILRACSAWQSSFSIAYFKLEAYSGVGAWLARGRRCWIVLIVAPPKTPACPVLFSLSFAGDFPE